MKKIILLLLAFVPILGTFAQIHPALDVSAGLSSNAEACVNVDLGLYKLSNSYSSTTIVPAIYGTVMFATADNIRIGAFVPLKWGTEHHSYMMYAGADYGKGPEDMKTGLQPWKVLPLIGMRYNIYNFGADVRWTGKDIRATVIFSICKPYKDEN